MSTIQEIALIWNSDYQESNLGYSNNDLTLENGLASAVIMSLFTDRRASDDDILPDFFSTDRRGWWGDLASTEIKNDQIGSRLWLLERSKTIPEVLVQAKEYVRESLEWLIEDGLASDIQITTERQKTTDREILAFKVHIATIPESIEGTGLSLTISFDTGSSGVDPREVAVLSFDNIDSITFDGVDELIF